MQMSGCFFFLLFPQQKPGQRLVCLSDIIQLLPCREFSKGTTESNKLLLDATVVVAFVKAKATTSKEQHQGLGYRNVVAFLLCDRTKWRQHCEKCNWLDPTMEVVRLIHCDHLDNMLLFQEKKLWNVPACVVQVWSLETLRCMCVMVDPPSPHVVTPYWLSS